MKPSSFILHPSSLRKGFSLPEVMFAIMILGIGFIMVAAMFPVAIQQAKANKESVSATMVGQRAIRCMQQAGDSLTMVGTPVSVLGATGGVYTYQENLGNPTVLPSPASQSNLWASIRGEMIESSDPRFAWTALYCRDAAATTADVIVFVVGCQETTQYEAADAGLPAVYPRTQFNLQPRLLEVRRNPDPLRGNRLQFQEATALTFGAAPPPGYNALGALAEGGYVVLMGRPTLADRGMVLQLTDYDSANDDWGVRVNDNYGALSTTTFEGAWVMGRTYNGGAGSYTGKAQDIALFKSTIRVR